MDLLGDLIQNIAIVGLMLMVYRLKQILLIQREALEILCKWRLEKR
jgi:hypothetical protein